MRNKKKLSLIFLVFTGVIFQILSADSIGLETADEPGLAPVKQQTELLDVNVPPVWHREDGQAVQRLTVTIRHVGEDAEASLQLDRQNVAQFRLKNGIERIEIKTPASENTREVSLAVLVDRKIAASKKVTIAPPRIRQIWILPHSHVDIGYTHHQSEIADIQIGYIEKAMELAEATADNPPGLRFKWNPEVVWTLENFIERAAPDKRQAFIEAVQEGAVGVEGFHSNLLTAVCRPEELAQSFVFGTRISDITKTAITSATICDVPGWTWGVVPIMAQAGIKYFCLGPNVDGRVGTIHQWDYKPFYWKSQSGQQRVLFWCVDYGYHNDNLEHHVLEHLKSMDEADFPYDMSFLFWVGTLPDGKVDNAPPDDQIVEKALAWNSQYAVPQVKIGLVGEFMSEFEGKYSKQLPEFSGDLTPYWEDGVGSASRETALNRASADRLSQAATLFVMRNSRSYPVSKFDQAWRNVLLFSEHTWGAYCSISRPDDPFTTGQWNTKQGFAFDAHRQANQLLKESLSQADEKVSGTSFVDVYNTTQWLRTDLAIVPPEMSGAEVHDENGAVVPSQRLASGQFVFLARDIPPFGAKRFRLSSRRSKIPFGGARADGNVLQTALLTVELDTANGVVRSLRLADLDRDIVDDKSGVGLNDYRYVLGSDVRNAVTNGPVRMSVLDSGPLVATIRIESEAPGCNRLIREVRVIDGLDRVEFVNYVDRKMIREKDGVHFGFGFNVPDGDIRMETPWAVVRPNQDQLPGACRNWFTVQRWVDVSNEDYGVTWAPLDAPLMEIGGITANLLGPVAYNKWMTEALDSQTIYSWAQNNHWFTNYKADQAGISTFRYILRPHRGRYSGSESARFGMETTRPLLVVQADPNKPVIQSLLTVSDNDVLVETVKMSDQGNAIIVRLFGVSGDSRTVNLDWNSVQPESTWLTDLTEKPLKRIKQSIEVPAYGVVNIRADLK